MTAMNNDSSTVELTFTEKWSSICNQQIYPGCSLLIRYAKQRLASNQSARVSDLISNQSDDTSADFYTEFIFHKKARPKSKLLSVDGDNPKFVSTVIEVPVYCREVILWFKILKQNGHCEYDSNTGANYVFPVRGNTTMVFPYNGEAQDKGRVTPGGTLRILYDSRRLPGRDFYLGEPAWDIQAVATFTQYGYETRKIMQATSDDVDPIMMCDFDVPDDARFVSIWFKYWGHFSGDYFDTNFGRNYVRSFEYDGEIWFTQQMKVMKKGYLLNGRKVCVLFDTNRIFEKGFSALKWLKLHAVFDGVVTEKNFGEVGKDLTAKTVVDIGENDSEFELWFTYGELESEKISFDSNFGQNYRFEVLY